MKKQFIYIIVIVLLTLVFGFSVFFYFDSESKQTQKQPLPQRTVENVLEKKDDILTRTQEKIEVLSSPKKKKQTFLTQEVIVSDLQKKIDKAFNHCQNLEKSKQVQASIKKELVKLALDLNNTNIFLVDYDGNTLLGENSKEDVGARTIVLEQIQKVRRHGEGFIVSNVNHDGLKRYIMVKNLDMNELFIGVDRYERNVTE